MHHKRSNHPTPPPVIIHSGKGLSRSYLVNKGVLQAADKPNTDKGSSGGGGGNGNGGGGGASSTTADKPPATTPKPDPSTTDQPKTTQQAPPPTTQQQNTPKTTAAPAAKTTSAQPSSSAPSVVVVQSTSYTTIPPTSLGSSSTLPTSSSAFPSATAAATSSNGPSGSTVGAVVGVLGGAVVLVGLIAFFVKRRRRNQLEESPFARDDLRRTSYMLNNQNDNDMAEKFEPPVSASHVPQQDVLYNDGGAHYNPNTTTHNLAPYGAAAAAVPLARSNTYNTSAIPGIEREVGANQADMWAPRPPSIISRKMTATADPMTRTPTMTRNITPGYYQQPIQRSPTYTSNHGYYNESGLQRSDTYTSSYHNNAPAMQSAPAMPNALQPAGGHAPSLPPVQHDDAFYGDVIDQGHQPGHHEQEEDDAYGGMY